MTDFKEFVHQDCWEEVSSAIGAITGKEVEAALSKPSCDLNDFMALISPAAQEYLEKMAIASRSLTQRRFGNTIQLYIPLYLTNSCVNHCVYCGFNHDNRIKRVILSDEEIMREAETIKRLGNFHNILLVTGEDPVHAGVDYLENAIRLLKPHFSCISLEVQPLKEEEYKRLSDAGMHAVYCYQETYHMQHYKQYHPRGIKADFDHRLEGFDRMGRAEVHKVGLGVLNGLEDWRTEALYLAMHLRYLQKNYWKTRYSVSFPRMRPHRGDGFMAHHLMSDKDLAQAVFAFRIFDNDIEIALSTRESAEFRDSMLTLGITSLSAGSKTEPGGYAVYKNELEQFAVNDDRSPEDIVRAVKAKNYEVVWKDWDMILQ